VEGSAGTVKHQKGVVTIPLGQVVGSSLIAVPQSTLGAAINKVTVASSVADRLITAIAVGVYSPGERLPSEREMARSLDVSRVTVRQALKQVAELGLIEARRGRGGGTFVSTESWEQIASETARRTLEIELPRLRDLFDFRCMVEGMIARAAAERRTADDVADLNVALAEFRRATEMEEARRLDRRLHGLICAAARNPHLSSLSAQLTLAATLGFGAEPYLEEFFDQAVAEHEELVGHVVRGEAHAANNTAQAHFSLTLETMKVRLSQATAGHDPSAERHPDDLRRSRDSTRFL
jgi:GntR family transcriptional repressor for pyruvate dehydrogenase complex